MRHLPRDRYAPEQARVPRCYTFSVKRGLLARLLGRPDSSRDTRDAEATRLRRSKKDRKDRHRKAPRGRALADIVAEILAPRSVTVVDVGARGGVGKSWYRVRPLGTVIGFEPDRAECDRLNDLVEEPAHERYVPVALASKAGETTFYKTVDPACCSIYRPNAALVDRYPTLKGMRLARTGSIQVTTLDNWLHTEGIGEVGFISLDAQGAELDILHGTIGALRGCAGIEAEVEFAPMYHGQPLFADLDAFLRGQGFELWRLSWLTHCAERPSGLITRKEATRYDSLRAVAEAGGGRLLWGRALYFRDFRALAASPDPTRRLLILATFLDAAGDLDAAAAAVRLALDRQDGSLAPGARGLLEGYLEVLHTPG